MSASPEQSAHTEARRKHAVALRLGGAKFQDIADQLGYADRASAFKDIQRAMALSAAELRGQAEELRALQAARYERLLMAVWPRAIQGDLRANERAEKLVARLSDLLGLNAPIQHEVITVDYVTQRIQQLSGELGRPVPERLALERGGAESPAAPEGPGDRED
jgi:hypothetical protein